MKTAKRVARRKVQVLISVTSRCGFGAFKL